MKLKKLIALNMALITVFSFLTVRSEATLNVNYDDKTQNVSITGVAVPNANVSIGVLHTDGQVDISKIDESNIHLVACYFGETTADENGNFTVEEFTMNGNSGNYDVYATWKGGTSNGNFYYLNPEQAIIAVKDLNTLKNNKDVNGLKAKIEGEAKLYNVDLTLYNEMKGKGVNVDEVYKMLITESDFGDLADLLGKFSRSCAVTNLNNLPSAAEYTNFLKSNAKLLGVHNENFYTKTFAKYIANQDLISQELMKKDFVNTGDFVKSFKSAVILKAVEINDWTSLDGIVKDNNDVFGAETYAKYVELSSYSAYKAQADKAIAKKTYANLESLAQSFTTAINKAFSDKNSAGSGGSGSGGGGSSSGGSSTGGGKVDMDIKAPIPNNTAKEPIKDDKDDKGESVIFADLQDVKWAENAIYSLAKQGIVKGVSENSFAPNNAVTREEFLVMLMRGLNIEPGGECVFIDVPENHYAVGYIAKASEMGIVNGISHSEFGLLQPVTREDLCVMTTRMLESKGIKLLGGKLDFNDSDSISEYAKESVIMLKTAKIVNGKDNNNFAPQDFATRAEGAKIIYEILNTFGGGKFAK